MAEEEDQEQGLGQGADMADMGEPYGEGGVGPSGVPSTTMKTLSLHKLFELSKSHVQDR